MFIQMCLVIFGTKCCPSVPRCLEDSAYKGDANCVLSILKIYSRMRSMGSRFTLGVWGLRVCSLDVAFTFTNVRNRLRSQPSATARNRPQPFATVRVIEGVIFGGFKRRVASFLMAGVGLRDIQTCFVTCRRSFCVAGAIFLRRFQKMGCSFRGRRNTLDVPSSFCVAGAAL